MTECNIDDILCKIRTIESIKNLRSVMGSESFIQEFPELEGLDTKLLEKLDITKADVQEAIAQCSGLLSEPIESVKLPQVVGNGGEEKDSPEIESTLLD